MSTSFATPSDLIGAVWGGKFAALLALATPSIHAVTNCARVDPQNQ